MTMERRPLDARETAKRLERWFDRHGRRFPWRLESDRYKLFIVELLLQRTRAETIEKIYREFFDMYPSLGQLASADVQELRGFFSRIGLKYRAERLKETARSILARYGGEVPCDADSLLKLKGVGVYIASALLNFGCGIPTPVVDRNVMLVLNRYAGITRETHAREIISEIYKYGDNRKIAYALIDIGALICRRELCRECPLDDLCPKIPPAKDSWRMLRKVTNKHGVLVLREQPVGGK